MNALVSPDQVRKAVVESLTNPSEDIARHVLAMAGSNPNQIEKAITTGTGLVAYDLQAPARNLYPVNTPIIRSLPRTGGVGTATNCMMQASGLVKLQNGQTVTATLDALDVAGVSTLKTIGQSLVSTAIASVLGKLAPGGSA